MNQPELGKKIGELRNKKGITQRTLSDACNIDIRTIQRIEAGEVTPRISTLKLIVEALDSDVNVFIENTQDFSSLFMHKILFVSFIAAIVNFVNWFFYTGFFPGLVTRYTFKVFVALSVIYMFTVAITYYGFYYLGKYQDNKLLKITSVVTIIITYLYVVTDLVVKDSSFPAFFVHIHKLVFYISNINGVLFGIALIKGENQKNVILYKITGILLVILAPLFFFSIIPVVIVACWLAALYFLLLTVILFVEHRFYKQNVALT